MEWHIVTGCKGGVGKTLLTLLLLAYHLEEKTNEGILVLDLNAMNTDTVAILRYGNLQSNSTDVTLNEPESRMITLRDISYEVSSEKSTFAVGWTTNPFLVYKYHDFADLLVGIKKHAETIANKLGMSPLQHVIIDSNYHFCNLFPRQDEQYDKRYQEICADDHFNILFLWVYRQLKKILEKPDDAEVKIIQQTAGAIERVFGPNRGSIIHTYNPLGLLPTEPKKGNWGWVQEKLPNRDEDYVIEDLKKLENLNGVGDYIKFTAWINQLQYAKKSQGKINSEDTHRLFSATLYKAVQTLAENELPINIFPLSIYQPALEGYTDRERDNVITELKKLETYKNFKKLLNRKYGNEIL